MKNSAECPKCQSVELMRFRGPGNTVPIGLRVVTITRYVCFTCGFTEEWIESRADRERLRDRVGFARDSVQSGLTIEDQLGLS